MPYTNLISKQYELNFTYKANLSNRIYNLLIVIELDVGGA